MYRKNLNLHAGDGRFQKSSKIALSYARTAPKDSKKAIKLPVLVHRLALVVENRSFFYAWFHTTLCMRKYILRVHISPNVHTLYFKIVGVPRYCYQCCQMHETLKWF